MILETIKSRWDELLKDGIIHYFPESNVQKILDQGAFPIKVKYAPERANRIKNQDSQTLPLGARIWIRKDCLYEFNKLILLANTRPVGEYHCILCSRLFHPQNDISYDEINEITDIVERFGLRGFLNLVGTAATLNHFHAQILVDKFNIESLHRIEVGQGYYLLDKYPGSHILITGSIEERCKNLFKIIEKLKKSELPYTVMKNGTLADSPLFTLLFWDNNILLVPRKKEWSPITGAMVGGLELSGYFLFSSVVRPNEPFEGLKYTDLIKTISKVTFSNNETEFLYN